MEFEDWSKIHVMMRVHTCEPPSKFHGYYSPAPSFPDDNV